MRRTAQLRADLTTQQQAALQRIERYEDWTAWPLFAGSVVFFAGFTWALVATHPDPVVRRWMGIATLSMWVWFWADYVIRFALAGKARGFFLRTRFFDLLSLILPFLRPFLIVVYVWRLPWFRRGPAARLRTRYVVGTVLFAFIYVYVSSYLVWLAERGAKNANIVNLGDAIWWGFTTIATVGYGDFVPVTVTGRFLAVSLMVGGVILIGVITASLISTLSDQLRTVAENLTEDQLAWDLKNSPDGASEDTDEPDGSGDKTARSARDD